MTNSEIIKKLRRLNTLLTLKKCSNNLALAVRKAIETIETWDSPVEEHLKKTPVKILFAGYGPKFIRLFDELVRTGDIQMIHELQPEFDPFFCDLCEIPGIGETMARRMFFDRSIKSMDDLRIAYTNNILQRIPAFGEVRFKAIENVLWHSQGKDHPSWGDLSAKDFLPPKDPEPDTMASQLELFSSDDVKNAMASGENTLEDAELEDDSSELMPAIFPDIPAKLPEDTASLSEPHPLCEGKPAPEIAEKAQSLTELFAALDRQGRSPVASSQPAVSPCSGEPSQAHAHYSQEFRASNSFLFRESQPSVLSDSEHEADLLLKTSSESELDAQISSAVEMRAPDDPEIASQLKAVIAKDLAEHGIQPDLQADQLCARNIVAGSLRAERVYAETIHARLVCAQTLQMHALVAPKFEEPLVTGDVHTDEVRAESIDAEYIEAREIHCRYLVAQMVREK